MIKRELYMQKIRPFIDTEVVKVITGIRRCGKSVMMQLIQKELQANGISDKQFISVNFESKASPETLNLESITAYITNRANEAGNKKLYLFFDEIQELSGWETLVNSFLIDINADIYITGSNARILSGELATYLAGRYIEVKMYPFSYSEVMELLSQQNTDLSHHEIFNLYVRRGGFPFLYNYPFSDNDASQYLSDIFSSIVLKDITQRHSIRDVGQLRQLVMFFIANIANTFSAGSLIKYLKNQRRNISTETIYNYIEYCTSACLLHLVKRQDIAGKALLATQDKIFIADHGLREALYGNNQRDINQVLENIVYIELLRRGWDVTVGKVKNTEVDFCAQRGNERIYIQVTYLLASEETIEREFKSLEGIQDNYPKYVLSLDEIDRSSDGIIHKNIRDFLLETI